MKQELKSFVVGKQNCTVKMRRNLPDYLRIFHTVTSHLKKSIIKYTGRSPKIHMPKHIWFSSICNFKPVHLGYKLLSINRLNKVSPPHNRDFAVVKSDSYTIYTIYF